MGERVNPSRPNLLALALDSPFTAPADPISSWCSLGSAPSPLRPHLRLCLRPRLRPRPHPRINPGAGEWEERGGWGGVGLARDRDGGSAGINIFGNLSG